MWRRENCGVWSHIADYQVKEIAGQRVYSILRENGVPKK
jgi:hypothetical protein